MALRTVLTLIGAGGITGDYIGADAVTGDKIADDAIDSEHVAAGSLDSEHYAAGSVDSTAIDDTVEQTSLFFCVVDCAADSNITLSGGAPQTVDGHSLAQNEDVLCFEQTDDTENGPYNVDTLGSSNDGTWTRMSERDTAAELPVGMLVYVKEGDTYGGKIFKLTAFNGTLETDSITFNEHEEGLTPTANGETEAVGTGDGSTTAFDLDSSGVAFTAVFVDGIQQPGSEYSISAGTGSGGVDQIVFGTAPANGAAIDAVVLVRN